MNLLSLLNYDYEPKLVYNEKTLYWELRFICNKINDSDCYDQLTRIDLEVLQENCNRISVQITDKLSKS